MDFLLDLVMVLGVIGLYGAIIALTRWCDHQLK